MKDSVVLAPSQGDARTGSRESRGTRAPEAQITTPRRVAVEQVAIRLDVCVTKICLMITIAIDGIGIPEEDMNA